VNGPLYECFAVVIEAKKSGWYSVLTPIGIKTLWSRYYQGKMCEGTAAPDVKEGDLLWVQLLGGGTKFTGVDWKVVRCTSIPEHATSEAPDFNTGTMT
jgi:hypothetical protein